MRYNRIRCLDALGGALTAVITGNLVSALSVLDSEAPSPVTAFSVVWLLWHCIDLSVVVLAWSRYRAGLVGVVIVALLKTLGIVSTLSPMLTFGHLMILPMIFRSIADILLHLVFLFFCWSAIQKGLRSANGASVPPPAPTDLPQTRSDAKTHTIP